MAVPAKSRPLSVTILLWGVIILGAVNGWRALGWFQQRQILRGLDVTTPLLIELILALVWCAVFLIVALNILRRRRSRWAVPLAIGLYGLYRIGLLVYLVVTPPATEALLLPAVTYGTATLLAIVICWWPGHADYWQKPNK
jgi:hypothetical protein